LSEGVELEPPLGIPPQADSFKRGLRGTQASYKVSKQPDYDG